MSTDSEEFKQFIEKYLKRDWRPEDGLPKSILHEAERELGYKLPKSLWALYSTIGNVKDLLSIHNKIYQPMEIELVDDHLVFMDENQSVVSWGIRLEEIQSRNPMIQQRNNTENTWYSEKQTLMEFLNSMFDWYSEVGVFDEIDD